MDAEQALENGILGKLVFRYPFSLMPPCPGAHPLHHAVSPKVTGIECVGGV